MKDNKSSDTIKKPTRNTPTIMDALQKAFKYSTNNFPRDFFLLFLFYPFTTLINCQWAGTYKNLLLLWKEGGILRLYSGFIWSVVYTLSARFINRFIFE